ncbi:MAG: DinB family protein [Flavobacteriales bacterium]|nr:DinB family protein [Flavobacteriales bacterium]
MDSLKLIHTLQKDTQEIIDFCESHLSKLNDEQLLQRPEPSRWSILECLEHMNLSSGHYINRLEISIPKAISKNQKFNPNFTPGFFGNKFSIGMLPDDKGNLSNSMKTFFFFEPKKAPSKKRNSYSEFIQLQHRTVALLEDCKQLDLNKNKVVSTLGPILIFKAGDAFRFAIAHNIRHILQVKRVLEKVI